MKFILGKKVKMTQIFNAAGEMVPVTVVEAGPCFVSQVKTKENDGYDAVQIAFGLGKNVKKPQVGHLKTLGLLKNIVEFRIENVNDFKVGDKIDVSVFAQGDIIKVTGKTHGRGFTGVVKRHGFAGGPASHGQKHQHRAPGSIGRSFPERVTKGMRMAGRSGFSTNTVRGLSVAMVDAENNLLAIKGALPGRRGTLLKIATI